MTPEVLPAMLSLRKLRHREHDVLGLFFPYDQDLIIQVKTLPDSKYSATWRCWSVPYTETHLRSVQKLGKLESFSLDHLASLSGTIAASPASDDFKTTMNYTYVTNPSWSTIQNLWINTSLSSFFEKSAGMNQKQGMYNEVMYDAN